MAAPTAAALIRSGRLVPLLLDHVADHYSLFVYYGSRAALPARVRHFIDLAIERFSNDTSFVLRSDELVRANAKGVRSLAAAAKD